MLVVSGEVLFFPGWEEFTVVFDAMLEYSWEAKLSFFIGKT